MPRKADPLKTFEAGRLILWTLCNALGDSDPRIQLAAARCAVSAARQWPDAIEAELIAAGTKQRRTRAAELAGIT